MCVFLLSVQHFYFFIFFVSLQHQARVSHPPMGKVRIKSEYHLPLIIFLYFVLLVNSSCIFKVCLNFKPAPAEWTSTVIQIVVVIWMYVCSAYMKLTCTS